MSLLKGYIVASTQQNNMKIAEHDIIKLSGIVDF